MHSSQDASAGAIPGAGTWSAAIVGDLHANCYLVDDGRGGVVLVDPGDEAPYICEQLGGRPVSAILVTHGHYDHLGAVNAMLGHCGSWVLSGADWDFFGEGLLRGEHPFGTMEPLSCPPARLVGEGDVIEAGELRLRVMACPGHSPGGVTYVEDRLGLAFTGDTLFAGTAGRCDFAGGSRHQLNESLARLAELPHNVVVLPGHFGASTIGAEIEANPYVRRAMRLFTRADNV